MKSLLLGLSLFFISFSITAQNTINEQFNNIIKESNTYQNYKVIKLNELNVLQRNTQDSINLLQSKIDNLSLTEKELKQNLQQVNFDFENLKQELLDTQEQVENISMFGIPTKKASYKNIVWFIIILLFIISGTLFYNYSNSFKFIKELKHSLSETENEFDEFRKRALEREQKLRRELLDEQKKNKA